MNNLAKYFVVHLKNGIVKLKTVKCGRQNWVLIVLLFTASCGKTPKEGGTFEIPMTVYQISEFTNFPSFQGKVLNKHIGSYLEKNSGKTNLFFTIFLEKTNGEQFAVSENPTSQNMFQIVNLLEKNHSYTFPNALTNGNQGGIEH
jgi:hypothetical protein